MESSEGADAGGDICFACARDAAREQSKGRLHMISAAAFDQPPRPCAWREGVGVGGSIGDPDVRRRVARDVKTFAWAEPGLSAPGETLDRPGTGQPLPLHSPGEGRAVGTVSS